MAVAITFADWLAALTEETEAGNAIAQTTQAVLQRWYDAAVRACDDYAPAAPAAPAVIADRAALMVGAYWLTEPAHTATTRTHLIGYNERWFDSKMAGNALRHSGAMATLTRYKRRRAL